MDGVSIGEQGEQDEGTINHQSKSRDGWLSSRLLSFFSFSLSRSRSWPQVLMNERRRSTFSFFMRRTKNRMKMGEKVRAGRASVGNEC